MSVDEEHAGQAHVKSDDKPSLISAQGSGGGITAAGLRVLVLLAIQNCSKNLIMRYAVKDKPEFLYSAAVIGSELTKLSLSTLYILAVDKGSLMSIFRFLRIDWWNSAVWIQEIDEETLLVTIIHNPTKHNQSKDNQKATYYKQGKATEPKTSSGDIKRGLCGKIQRQNHRRRCDSLI